MTDNDVRIAVLEDRVERAHRDIERIEKNTQAAIAKIEGSITDLHELIRNHMRREEKDRREMALNISAIRQTLGGRIESVNNKFVGRRQFIGGIAAAVSVMWGIAIVVARAIGWL